MADYTNQHTHLHDDDISEYKQPPSPKPIYNPPPVFTSSNPDNEELYDDIDNYKCNGNARQNELNQQQNVNSSEMNHVGSSPKRLEIGQDNSYQSPKTGPHQKPSIDMQPELELEHYQTPKSDCCRQPQIPMEVEEEMYDDVASASEKARMYELAKQASQQKSANEKRNLPSTSPEKKHWNRFSGGRKSKPAEVTTSERDKECSDELVEYDDCLNVPNEQCNSQGQRVAHEQKRTRNFQALLNKVESSLHKTSSRPPMKPHTSSTNT